MIQREGYSPTEGVSSYFSLVNMNYDGLIHSGLNVSFLTALLYRNVKDLPPSLSASIHPDVFKHAQSASGWDVPGDDHFKKPYQGWVNRIGMKKRWMFFVHSGVYISHDLDASGVTHDDVDEAYDRQRPTRGSFHHRHVLDNEALKLQQAFTRVSALDEARVANVRADLLYNLSSLQMAQSRIISRYLGETEGFIQPAVLSDAVDLGMSKTDQLLDWRVKDWLPTALLKAMELYTVQTGGNVERNDFYFDI